MTKINKQKCVSVVHVAKGRMKAIATQDDTTLPYMTPGIVASVYPNTWAGILGGMVAE